MLDDRGGWKGLDSAALRDTVEAATMVGRLHSAWRAVELGFQIAPDHGPSGNLRHWQIPGIPPSYANCSPSAATRSLSTWPRPGSMVTEPAPSPPAKPARPSDTRVSTS